MKNKISYKPNHKILTITLSLLLVLVFFITDVVYGVYVITETENSTLENQATVSDDIKASGGSFVLFGDSGGSLSLYEQNLNYLRAQPWRNTNEDDSPYRDWPMSEIDKDVSILYGPKQDYVDGGFQEEELFLDSGNGNMRLGCEFSHFGYDDPIVFPGQPQAAHLHMFFGNTDINAYSTWDTVYNSGGGTCNGGELNRTGYWVPAMFDENGNVRVPDFLNIYYKHDLMQNHSEDISYYPENMQILADDIAGDGYLSFACLNEWGGDFVGTVRFIDELQCPGGLAYGVAKRYLEHNVLFQNCWNGQDPSDYDAGNTIVSQYSYFGGPCPSSHPIRLPNIRYRVRYVVEEGDDTSKWFLASDVNRETLVKSRGGSTNHGDWWGGWNKEVNKIWVDRCNNVLGASCGYGYLDAKSLTEAPDGIALRYREKYTGPVKIPAQDIYNQLCSHAKPLSNSKDAAWCKP